MGRKNREKYYRTLHQQAHEKLVQMQAFGDKRMADKKTGADQNKIYAFTTYHTYRRAVMRFVKYIGTHHPECTTLKKSKKYVNEWLQSRVDSGMSAWTVSMEASALCKLFGILPDDRNRFHAPQRRREDIKRSRVDAARDRHFSKTNNAELINFVCCTGTRRNVLERLLGDDLWSRERLRTHLEILLEKAGLTNSEQTMKHILEEALETFPDQHWYLLHRRDKGGKTRLAPIFGSGSEHVIERMQNTAPEDLVWHHVHAAADIHYYRSRYAQRLYWHYERPIDTIPFDKVNQGTGRTYQSCVYVCKNDEKGRKLDREALLKVSRALGHNRIDVLPRNYLYGM